MAVTEIKNESVIEKDIEKAIKDRLFNGFNNWNGGYKSIKILWNLLSSRKILNQLVRELLKDGHCQI